MDNVLIFAAIALVFLLLFMATMAMEGRQAALDIWTRVYLPILGMLAAAWLGQAAVQWLR